MIDLDDVIDHQWLFSHKDLILVTRDGLGDQITGAGLTVWMSQHVRRVYLPCRRVYFTTVDWMYKSIDNIIPIAVDQGISWETFEIMSKQLDAQLCRSMIQYPLRTEQPWFRAAYSQYNLDYNTRFEYFPQIQQGPLAQRLFDTIVKQPRYRVVHNNSNEKSSYDIDMLQGRSQQEFDQLQTIYVDPAQTNNLFDWLLILQRAEEIQLVASSVYCLCQQISSSLTGQVMFHHIRDYCADTWERDILPYHPTWKWIDYPFKQWR